MNFKVLFKISFLLLFFFIYCGENANKNKTANHSPKADSLFVENQWYEFIFTKPKIGYDQKIKWEKTKNKIKIERSEFQTYKGRTHLIVFWRAINTSHEPNYFTWENKYVMDEEKRLFAPNNGYYSKLIQPLDETGLLRVSYDLPAVVNVNNLFWGLYYGKIEEGLKYKIKLTPKHNIN